MVFKVSYRLPEAEISKNLQVSEVCLEAVEVKQSKGMLEWERRKERNGEKIRLRFKGGRATE
uniref:Uncharacterized protein n=1 Tax=Cucumis melo TaxID=3656 RepID=A0A9I9DUA9_CUCME